MLVSAGHDASLRAGLGSGPGSGLAADRMPDWPLAVTLGVHLLFGWWWLHATSVRMLPSNKGALREFVVVTVRPLPAPASPESASAPASAPAPALATPPGRTPTPPSPAPPAVPLDRARVASPVAPPTITTAPTPVADVNTPSAAGEPMADPAAAQAGTAATAASIQDGIAAHDDSTAGRAKGAAGAADNALRKGKLAPLDPSDSKWHRFAQAVAGARVDRSRTLISESYTSPDGVTIYRFRQGGRTYCRTGGDVKPSPFGAQVGGATLFDKVGGGGFAGTIACPAGVPFKPD